jgi:hypothetical protein
VVARILAVGHGEAAVRQLSSRTKAADGGGCWCGLCLVVAVLGRRLPEGRLELSESEPAPPGRQHFAARGAARATRISEDMIQQGESLARDVCDVCDVCDARARATRIATWAWTASSWEVFELPAWLQRGSGAPRSTASSARHVDLPKR